MKAKILLVEGKRADRPSFVAGLTRKGYQLTTVPTGARAIAHLEQEKPDMVVINAASMRTSGRRICLSVRKKYRELPIVLILDDHDDENIEKDGIANEILSLPFTLQKLLNRMRPLLPAQQKDLIQVGSLQLDTVHRVAYLGNRQARLTPRLVVLLQALMERPGIVLPREDLFKIVWETDYTGDTRSLDVHVSWLRKALGEDPHNPQMIKTVRGIGYRLDLDEAVPPVINIEKEENP
ncbi:MAG TPA: response regulator transcription factor [Anaerolineaceae bacterium]